MSVRTGETLNPPTGLSADPSSPTAAAPHDPGTPRTFTLGPNTHRLVDEARERNVNLEPIVVTAATRAYELARIEERIRMRRRNSIQGSQSIVSFQDAIQRLYNQVQATDLDLADVTSIMIDAQNHTRTLAEAFRNVPTIPASYSALVEMLEVYSRLEALYHKMWAQYGALRKDVQPLRHDMARFEKRVELVDQRLDDAPTEAVEHMRPELELSKKILERDLLRIHSQLSSLDHTYRSTITDISKGVQSSIKPLHDTNVQILDDVNRVMSQAAVLSKEQTLASPFPSLERSPTPVKME